MNMRLSSLLFSVAMSKMCLGGFEWILLSLIFLFSPAKSSLLFRRLGDVVLVEMDELIVEGENRDG